MASSKRVALGRALTTEPEVLIIGEHSMGLAPVLIKEVCDTLAGLHQQGLPIVLLEEMATYTVPYSDIAVILNRGRTVYSGHSRTAAAN